MRWLLQGVLLALAYTVSAKTPWKQGAHRNPKEHLGSECSTSMYQVIIADQSGISVPISSLLRCKKDILYYSILGCLLLVQKTYARALRHKHMERNKTHANSLGVSQTSIACHEGVVVLQMAPPKRNVDSWFVNPTSFFQSKWAGVLIKSRLYHINRKNTRRWGHFGNLGCSDFNRHTHHIYGRLSGHVWPNEKRLLARLDHQCSCIHVKVVRLPNLDKQISS